MNKVKIIFTIVVISLFMSCFAEKIDTIERTYTNEELQTFTHPLHPLGVYFWDCFGSLEKKYSLSKEESMILGAWNGFEKQSATGYYFFPNKLFLASFREHTYLGSPRKYFGDLVGIWYIRDGVLEVEILANLLYESEYFYKQLTPYTSEIIKISDIDPIGYTKRPMAIVNIPQDIKRQLNPKTMRYKPVRMARSLYSTLPLNPKPDDISYGYFNQVKDMAMKNLTGEEIATSPNLVKEFFGKTIH